MAIDLATRLTLEAREIERRSDLDRLRHFSTFSYILFSLAVIPIFYHISKQKRKIKVPRSSKKTWRVEKWMSKRPKMLKKLTFDDFFGDVEFFHVFAEHKASLGIESGDRLV